MAAAPRFVLSGYYGCGNLGDEAVLQGILTSLSRETGSPLNHFNVLSASPSETIRAYGVSAVDRMNSPAVRQAIKQCDLLISGGGSLFQDVTSFRSILYYLWALRQGASLGKPVMIYAQGVGPLNRPISRMLVRWGFNRVQSIAVRDEDSATLLRDIGVNRPPIEVTADPAFALEPDHTKQVASALGNSEGTMPIIFAARPWGTLSPALLGNALGAVCRELQAPCLAVPFHRHEDLGFAQEIAQSSDGCIQVSTGELTAREFIALSSRARMVVAMRLHALILGAVAHKTLAGLSYDPKVDALMARLGQKDAAIPASTASAEAIAELILKVDRESTVRAADIATKVITMRQLCDRTAQIAADLPRHQAIG